MKVLHDHEIASDKALVDAFNRDHDEQTKLTAQLFFPDAIVAEMARVRDHVLPYYTPEVNGQFAAVLIRQALDDAARALASGDVVQMLTCFEELKGWNA